MPIGVPSIVRLRRTAAARRQAETLLERPVPRSCDRMLRRVAAATEEAVLGSLGGPVERRRLRLYVVDRRCFNDRPRSLHGSCRS